MLNEFSRTQMLIGEENLNKLKNTTVAVFGIGGVGSFVTEGLARAGIGKLVLIDNDDICITNINRQIHANHKTIGKSKVEVMRERILDINPAAKVTAIQKFYLPDCSDELMRDDYDYIVDAVDTVTAKIDLILQAQKRNIPIISSMGTGNKLDPTRLEITDIYKTSMCPLAKIMRKELRVRGIDSLKVIYSKESPIKPIQEEDTQYDACTTATKQGVNNIRKHQIPGSMSFVPSVAGLIISSEIVRDIIGN